ncbi:MAG: hypothetical protein ACPG5B_15850 [Chitinophagales bacterium]
MKKSYFFILTFLWLIAASLAFANNDKNTLGARSAAMANVSVTFADAFSVFSNQAGLARLEGMTLGVYAENRFLVQDLGQYAVGFALPTKSGTFGLGINYFGGSLYNETKINLAYGRNLFEKLAVGVEFDFMSINVSEFGSKSAITFGLGAIYNLTPEFTIGGHIYNPLRLKLTDDEADLLPTTIKFGLAFQPAKKITLIAESEKTLMQPAMFKVGLEYRIIEKLYLRGGVGTQPTAMSFGIGLNLNSINIDLSASYHQTLGYSPQISFVWQKK